MSFLDSVLSSIETGKPTLIPTPSPAPSPPISSSNVKSEARKSTPTARPVPSDRKNGITSGTKRKVEETLSRPQKLEPSVSARPTLSKKATPPASSAPRPSSTSTSTLVRTSTGSAAPAPQKKNPPVSSKPPPKGSYADLMLKAKALQQNAPTQVGMFKHQPAAKEKLSKAERKKRLMEAQAKEKDPKLAKKAGVGANASTGVKAGSTKLAAKREAEEPAYKGTARPTKPSQPEYRGTAGLPSKYGDRRGQLKPNKRRRIDEYLGTDEEDEGDYADDYDDYYSESSDMEAGLGDVEEEEAAALAAARREDEEEWRAELAAKQQKLERRKKLSMLASKRS